MATLSWLKLIFFLFLKENSQCFGYPECDSELKGSELTTNITEKKALQTLLGCKLES